MAGPKDEKPKTSKPKSVTLDSLKNIEFLPSGLKEIDELIGGFPKGRMTEIVGPEGIGKSTIVSMCAAELSKTGSVLYVDAEQSLNKDRVAQLGGNLKKIDYMPLYELEEASEAIIEAAPKYDAIIVDSIATLTPRGILDGDVGANNIGLYARQMSKWVKQLKPVLASSKCAFIAVNQYRQSPDMYKPRYIPGGTAYAYALDLRLELSMTPSKDKILEEGVQVAHWITAKITKSRVCVPYRQTRIKISYGKVSKDV